jgi:UDP-GlcNAc:undecaprenyl-phosphate GlcNAc-1-phosphate transferase
MAIAAFLVASGFCTQIIFFAPVVNVAVSVLWIVAVMNAFNFLDILDGLAAGISVITALTFVVIATCTRNTQVVLMALALLGGNLSFLAFNFPRARLYMGDMGSLFNGVVFAIMTMLVSYAVPGKEVAFLTPLLIMALPLYDLIFVMAMRFVARKPLAQKSRDHFVLRLVHRGLKVPHAVVLMYFFDLLFSGTAILFLMSSRSWVLAASLLGATAVAWFLCAYHLSRVEVGKAP